MPIAELMANPEFQIIEKIRLGATNTNAKGAAYPEDLDHFSFRTIPEPIRSALIKIYGEKPRELDIMFVSNDILEIIPNDFKMFGQGKIGADGQRKGGKLLCKGPGPTIVRDGDEVIENPGVAEWWAQRDPETRVIPPRPCLGTKCPDYLAEKCKQTMQVIFILPLYSWQVGFAIDTTSWNSIRSFIGLLTTTKTLTQGQLRHIPFKLVREETQIPYWCKKTKTDKVSTHHCMYLRPNDDFYERAGPAALKNVELLKKVQFSLKNAIQELTAGPMEDNFVALPASDAEAAIEVMEEKKLAAEDVLNDPEVQDLFAELETSMGRKFDTKSRLVAIRNKENAPDLKAAVVAELTKKIATAKPKVTPQSSPEPAVKPASEGIL
jgi:hypothetical protein